MGTGAFRKEPGVQTRQAPVPGGAPAGCPLHWAHPVPLGLHTTGSRVQVHLWSDCPACPIQHCPQQRH